MAGIVFLLGMPRKSTLNGIKGCGICEVPMMHSMIFGKYGRVALLLILLMGASLHAARLTVTANADSSVGSLRTTVAASGPGDTVVFNLNGNDTAVLCGSLLVDRDLVIDGRNDSRKSRSVVRQQCYTRTFTVSGKKVVFKNLVVMSGKDSGGALLYLRGQSANVVVDNCLFTGGNCSKWGGGAVYLDTGNLLIANSTLCNNTARNGSGGAICNARGNLALVNDSLYGNAIDKYGSGGALYNDRGFCAISRCAFLRNRSAEGDGGAIFNNNGAVKLDTCVLAFNSCKQSGGGIYNGTGYCAINASTIANDSARYIELRKDLETFTPSSQFGRTGGGIYNISGIVFIQNSTICGNYAEAMALDIYNPGNYLSTYTYTASGGGLYNQSGRVFALNSTFSANVAAATGTSGSSIVGVTSISKGAGVYNEAGSLTLHNTTFFGDNCESRASTYAWSDRSAWWDGSEVYSENQNCFVLNTIVMSAGSGSDADYRAEAGSRGVNSIFRNSLPATTRSCTSNIAPRQVFGVDTPNLADNGGPSKTVCPAAGAVIAFQAGVQSGLWFRDSMLFSLPVRIPYSAYLREGVWFSLENDSALAPTVLVKEIINDQRAVPRRLPPCVGAVEFDPGNVKVTPVAFRRPVSFDFAMVNYRLIVKGANAGSIEVDIFDLSGRRVIAKALISDKNTALPRHLKGAYIFRIAWAGEKVCRKIVIR
jgi:hypothetical protein